MKAIVTVIGKDTVGIIAYVSGILSENNVNILDISQTVMQDYFTMIMMVDTSKAAVDFAALSKILEDSGHSRGLEIHIQREDIFIAMHRI